MTATPKSSPACRPTSPRELTAAGFTGRVTLSAGVGGDDLKLDAVDSDIDFTISAANANSGLTNAAYTSTSLLDSIGGAATL